MPRASRKDEEAQERTCLVLREAEPRGALIRFALGPDGVVTPDLAEKLPGRGAWVTARRSLVAKAAAANMYGRAFRREAKLPDGVSPEAFAASVDAQLKARALAAIGLARRAGDVAVGFDLVDALLRSGRAGVLFVAADSSLEGRGKLTRLAGAAPVFEVFTSADLSGALGREGLCYVAIKLGAAAERAASETRRWLAFSAEDDESGFA